MREILFRGKRTDNNKWIEGGYCYCNNKSYIVITTRYIPDTRDWDEADYYEKHPVYKPMFIEVIPETVGQYTGLTDKNGKKIFEGDIILFEDESPTNYEYHDCTEMRCGEIKFHDGQFYLTNRYAVEMGDLVYDEKLDGRVIGNIHDNPELLSN